MKREIKGFENYYVTNCGKVFNSITGNQKKPQLQYGYEHVTLFKKQKFKRLRVHRLVAEAFIPNPKNIPQVNHKNGVKTDNRVCNLEWCTLQENIKHSWENGLSKIYYGERTSSAKLTRVEVGIIRDSIKQGFKQKDIARYFKLDQSNISKINTKLTWA